MRLRWVARGTALLMFATFAAFFLGEHVNYSALNRTQAILMIAVFIALAGLVIGWHSELLGGTVNIAGVLAFYSIHFAARGSWPPRTFPLLALPGLLFLFCWWRDTQARR